MKGIPNTCRKTWAILGLGSIAAIVLIVLAKGPAPDPPAAGSPDEVRPVGRTGIPTSTITFSDLGELPWQQLPQAIRDLGKDPSTKQQITSAAADFQNPAAVYLKALFLIAENKPEEALASFDEIRLESIPPVHLYAPFRLSNLLRPGAQNRYRIPLEGAVPKGQLPALIRARAEASSGHLQEALLSYTRSDPEKWKKLDISMLANIHRHAGLSPDADILIRGALRGGRVSDTTRSGLLAILDGATPNSGSELKRKQALKEKLLSDPTLKELATRATVNQLAARKSFVNREYAKLLGIHRESDPKKATDETAVMLLLSAARMSDSRATDRWSQEIRRRFPSTEVKSWLETLHSSK